MKKIFLSIVFISSMVSVAICDNPPPPFNPGDPSPIPVDGGVSLLLAAGAAYGVKKVRDKKKQTEDPEVFE